MSHTNFLEVLFSGMSSFRLPPGNRSRLARSGNPGSDLIQLKIRQAITSHQNCRSDPGKRSTAFRIAAIPAMPVRTTLCRRIIAVAFFAMSFLCLGTNPSNAADWLYVSHTRDIVRFDISLTDALAVKNSMQDFAPDASAFLSFPEFLTFDATGNLYASNAKSTSNPGNTIARITPSGVPSYFANSMMNNPQGLAFDSAGNLYVANKNSNNIVKFNPGGLGSIFASSNLNLPTGLVIAPGNNFYASNFGNSPTADSSISRFTSGGSGSNFASADSPIGIARDSAGNFYTASFSGNSIDRTTSGGVTSRWITAEVTSPRNLTFDSSGNLYVINGNDTVAKFDSSGVYQFTWRLKGPGLGIAYNNIVPEPSTYVLCTIAAGTIAWIARRRKQRGNVVN